ncbi:MAG: hypothetical protein JXQ23_08835 [Clostridia bacterium]|nr:hypothetical protein [Clostridia bacterium]
MLPMVGKIITIDIILVLFNHLEREEISLQKAMIRFYLLIIHCRNIENVTNGREKNNNRYHLRTIYTIKWRRGNKKWDDYFLMNNQNNSDELILLKTRVSMIKVLLILNHINCH